MNPNILRALLATSGGASAALTREALDPARLWFFIEPSAPTLPVALASPDELVQLCEQAPALRVIDFRSLRKSEATRHAHVLTLHRQAALEVEAAPEPQDDIFGSWMIRHRLLEEDVQEGRPRATSTILPVEEATQALLSEGTEGEDWHINFVLYLPRRSARITARCLELLAEDKEATRREAARQAAEQAAAEGGEP